MSLASCRRWTLARLCLKWRMELFRYSTWFLQVNPAFKPFQRCPITYERCVHHRTKSWECHTPALPLKAPFYQYLLTYSDILSLSLQALPYFFIFIFLESIIRWLQRKPLPRLNDSINSISAGAIEQLGILVTGTVGVASYAWVYEHWRIADLPWDSALTWWLAFLGVDCGYYWFHRMAHG